LHILHVLRIFTVHLLDIQSSASVHLGMIFAALRRGGTLVFIFM
jgi:hypothetical protein